jgi:importin subunit beta-1
MQLVLSLQASVPKARMACAQAIAKVGKIEIPHKLWPEILEGLVATSTATGVPVGLKAASVNTLGMICEEIMEVDVFEQPQIDAILGAIVTCMDNGEDPEVRSFATKALYNALDFAE